MKGIEKDLLEMSVNSLRKAYEEISSLRCNFAAEIVGGGKADTYGLDAITEEVIKRGVDDYDANIVLVTEETGKMYSGEQGLEPTQTVLICDPTDKSIKMREFLQSIMKRDPGFSKKYVYEAFKENLSDWERDMGNPTISGASGSITAIRDRRIVFNVMVNYITGEIFIADSTGTRKADNIKGYEENKIKAVGFSSESRNTQKFAAYLGKEGYSENLKKCNLGLSEEDTIDPWVEGPLRILRLSSIDEENVSFILSNGEKICEWIGWLSWVKYARDPLQSDEHALEAYRLFFENPRTKELVSVAPGPHYSIFTMEDSETRVNLDRMFQLSDPSHYRETILVTPKHNVGPISRVKSLGKHQLELLL
ncbi:MAG: hypothetical protein AABW46_03265 [Nanoarchaeota archaeon]